MTKTIRHKLRKADIYLGECPIAGYPTIYWAAETDDNMRHLECGSCLATTTEDIEIYSPDEAEEFVEERKKPQSLKEWAEAAAQWICGASSDSKENP